MVAKSEMLIFTNSFTTDNNNIKNSQNIENIARRIFLRNLISKTSQDGRHISVNIRINSGLDY